jgi:hypothetical protein
MAPPVPWLAWHRQLASRSLSSVRSFILNRAARASRHAAALGSASAPFIPLAAWGPVSLLVDKSFMSQATAVASSARPAF